MLEQLAEEYLSKAEKARKPKEKASITLDAETLAILERRKNGNLKLTAKELIKLADRVLTETENARQAKLGQNLIVGRDAQGQKKAPGEGR